VESFCKHCSENSGSIKCWEFNEYLNKCWLLKKDLNSIELVNLINLQVCTSGHRYNNGSVISLFLRNVCRLFKTIFC
jgi:hypothetical protein